MSKKDKKFDIMLDASEVDFAEKLKQALGFKDGDEVTFITPQFERVDGRVISYFPKIAQEYEALATYSEETLKKIGCQKWDKENGKVCWLFPKEWYDFIPNGLKIIDINWEEEIFEKGKTDDDVRFGALSYGFIQEALEAIEEE